MAHRKATPKSAAPATVTQIGTFGPIYRAFRKRMDALGCVLCPACYAYVWPTHVHGTPALQLDEVA